MPGQDQPPGTVAGDLGQRTVRDLERPYRCRLHPDHHAAERADDAPVRHRDRGALRIGQRIKEALQPRLEHVAPFFTRKREPAAPRVGPQGFGVARPEFGHRQATDFTKVVLEQRRVRARFKSQGLANAGRGLLCPAEGAGQQPGGGDAAEFGGGCSRLGVATRAQAVVDAALDDAGSIALGFSVADEHKVHSATP